MSEDSFEDFTDFRKERSSGPMCPEVKIYVRDLTRTGLYYLAVKLAVLSSSIGTWLYLTPEWDGWVAIIPALLSVPVVIILMMKFRPPMVVYLTETVKAPFDLAKTKEERYQLITAIAKDYCKRFYRVR